MKKKDSKGDEIKTFCIRIPKEIWVFLKKAAVEKDTSMMNVIIESINLYKKNYKKA